MKINCIAIDDEPLALEMIQKSIVKVTHFKLLNTFHSASEALKYLAETRVDCIFLDIEIPGLNGLEFSKIIGQFSYKPLVVFVTAYNHYAIKKYQTGSIGFLLKPFSFMDFNAVAEKVKSAWLLQRNSIQKTEPFFIKVEAEQVKIFPRDILYVESMGDYVKIFLTNERKPLIPLITLKKMKSLLPPASFLQINRSQIVNIQKIDSYTANGLTLAEKTFSVSNSFRNEFNIIKHLVL